MNVPRAITAVVGILVMTLALAGTAAAESGVSGGATYTVDKITIQGLTPDGSGRWHADVAQLVGGDPAVSKAFNAASQASARGQIDRFTEDRVDGRESSIESTGHVTFRPTAVAQLIHGIVVWSALHPPNWDSTVVIDSRTAEPITLADLFADEQAGLNRLSEQTRLLVPNANGEYLANSYASGTAPVESNFANWIPTDAGIELHFEESQFGGPAFAQVITVPWSALTDVLAPDMAGLAAG